MLGSSTAREWRELSVSQTQSQLAEQNTEDFTLKESSLADQERLALIVVT